MNNCYTTYFIYLRFFDCTVGSSKWVEYVFEDDEEPPESEVDGDDVEEEFEEEPDFDYGTDCIIGVPGQVDVLTPGKARNKGCGNGGRPKGGRIEGGKEKFIKAQNKVANKGKRKCRKCGQYKGHDSRNCTEV